MIKDALGDRMKMYEQMEAGRMLIPTLPVCIRIDGKCFSTFTNGLKRPFDEDLHKCMVYTTSMLVEHSNAKIGYTQSDEITLILKSDRINSQILFNGKIQKLTSVLASMATFFFQEAKDMYLGIEHVNKHSFFDCRVWNVPNEMEAFNTLYWRELDCTKNAVSMVARYHLGPSAIKNKSSNEMQELLFQKGINFNDLPVWFKRGTYVRSIATERKFTIQELTLLPEKHQARSNPDLKILRHELKCEELPKLSQIENVLDVIFRGEKNIKLKTVTE